MTCSEWRVSHRSLTQGARDALVTDRTAARNRQKHLRHPLLKQQSKTRLSQIDRHLAAVDAAIGKRLAEDLVLARRTEICPTRLSNSDKSASRA